MKNTGCKVKRLAFELYYDYRDSDENLLLRHVLSGAEARRVKLIVAFALNRYEKDKAIAKGAGS